MADSTFRKIESQKSSLEKKEDLRKEEKIQDSKEVKEVSESGRGAYEAIGVHETVETTGKVSEVLSEQGEVKGDAAVSSKQTFDPAQIKAQLLQKLPNEKVMRKQIESEIKSEIKYLHKKAMKMLRSPGSMSYFEMNNLMKKIRELKGIFKRLAKATVEGLKTLWLRYVHGIM